MSTEIHELMQDIGKRARSASRAMARASSEQKNQALLQIAKLVRQKADEIQQVNQVDVARAKKNGQDPAFIDRLAMTPKTIETMALGLEQIVSLEDPIGKMTVLSWKDQQVIFFLLKQEEIIELLGG